MKTALYTYAIGFIGNFTWGGVVLGAYCYYYQLPFSFEFLLVYSFIAASLVLLMVAKQWEI